MSTIPPSNFLAEITQKKSEEGAKSEGSDPEFVVKPVTEENEAAEPSDELLEAGVS